MITLLLSLLFYLILYNSLSHHCRIYYLCIGTVKLQREYARYLHDDEFVLLQGLVWKRQVCYATIDAYSFISPLCVAFMEFVCILVYMLISSIPHDHSDWINSLSLQDYLYI